jgi:hypothetical protein
MTAPWQPLKLARLGRVPSTLAGFFHSHDRMVCMDNQQSGDERHQNPHLRRDLQHHEASSTLRTRATRSGTCPEGR